MNADKRRYNAANLRSFAFICGSNSPVYLAGDYKLILIGYSMATPKHQTLQYNNHQIKLICVFSFKKRW